MINNTRVKRILSFAALFITIATVLVLTFLPPEQTWSLSETVRIWLVSLGFNPDPLVLRSNAHFVEYFVVGIAVIMFGRAMRWKTGISVVISCAFGLIDELIKISLPTREFDFVDLVKDWVGVGLALLFVYWTDKDRKQSEG